MVTQKGVHQRLCPSLRFSGSGKIGWGCYEIVGCDGQSESLCFFRSVAGIELPCWTFEDYPCLCLSFAE